MSDCAFVGWNEVWVYARVCIYVCVCVSALQCCTPRHLLSLNWKLKRRIRESPVSLCAVKLFPVMQLSSCAQCVLHFAASCLGRRQGTHRNFSSQHGNIMICVSVLFADRESAASSVGWGIFLRRF